MNEENGFFELIFLGLVLPFTSRRFGMFLGESLFIAAACCDSCSSLDWVERFIGNFYRDWISDAYYAKRSKRGNDQALTEVDAVESIISIDLSEIFFSASDSIGLG